MAYALVIPNVLHHAASSGRAVHRESQLSTNKFVMIPFNISCLQLATMVHMQATEGQFLTYRNSVVYIQFVCASQGLK